MKIVNYDFTMQEAALMLMLVANLNPDNYKHSSAKSLIYKAKAAKEADREGKLVNMRIRP